jgi:hypothetical protein
MTLKEKYQWSNIKWFINPYLWIKPFWVSFIEEGIQNPRYKNYVGGRVEIWTHWSAYDINEYRFLTKDTEGYYRLREKYDFETLSYFGLRKLRNILIGYNEYVP